MQRIFDKVACGAGSILNPSNLSVNVINHMILMNIWAMKTVSAGKN